MQTSLENITQYMPVLDLWLTMTILVLGPWSQMDILPYSLDWQTDEQRQFLVGHWQLIHTISINIQLCQLIIAFSRYVCNCKVEKFTDTHANVVTKYFIEMLLLFIMIRSSNFRVSQVNVLCTMCQHVQFQSSEHLVSYKYLDVIRRCYVALLSPHKI